MCDLGSMYRILRYLVRSSARRPRKPTGAWVITVDGAGCGGEGPGLDVVSRYLELSSHIYYDTAVYD